MTKIILNDIRKVYGVEDQKVMALNGVSTTISDGEFVAICGTSGSGKTTLLNIIGGIDVNYQGDCIINGENISQLSNDDLVKRRRREVGVIFQNFNLIESLTVEENITLPVEIDGEEVTDYDVNNIMKKFEIFEKRNAFVEELSGGQKQRVAIARVFLSGAKLILADEPTGNLDTKNSFNFINILKDQIKEKKITVLMVTHDDNIARMADRIIWLEDGRIVKDEIFKTIL